MSAFLAVGLDGKWRGAIQGTGNFARFSFVGAAGCRSSQVAHRVSDGAFKASAIPMTVRQGSARGATVTAGRLFTRAKADPWRAPLSLGSTGVVALPCQGFGSTTAKPKGGKIKLALVARVCLLVLRLPGGKRAPPRGSHPRSRWEGPNAFDRLSIL
jgi:hypothetical protein